MKKLPHVVVIGAGFGGLRAAKALKRSPVTITVIDKRNHHLFQPLLYQVATANLSPADIAYPVRSVLRGQDNAEVVMAEVSAVDLSARTVTAGERTIPYDYLVVATGARHSYFNHPEWEEFAPGLKTLGDATHVRSQILKAFEQAEMAEDMSLRAGFLTFVIVGGGPTGVEMAGAIAELAHRALGRDFRRIDPTSTRVLLVEAGPRVLASFPESLSAKAAKALEKLGVDVRVGARVTEVTAHGVRVGEEWISSANIIWAAGVIASPAGKWFGAKTDGVGRVEVDAFLNLPNHPEVYVIGDTALVKDENGAQLPGVAPVAMQEGIYVAKRLNALVRGEKPVEPFKYWNKGNLATIGRSSAVADFGAGIRLGGLVAWAAWLVVHIYYLIGFRNRLLVLIQWAWAYVTFQRGARLITEKISTPAHPPSVVKPRVN